VFKFNSNHIITGQIKQILNSFNLPSYKIYTAQNYKFFLDHGYESPELADGLYIKWDSIVEFKNGKWIRDLDSYEYNNSILNYTQTFPIKNNIYDSDTHEYLGNFLRFQRDYLGIDLMPLYNCFSNRVCSNLNISIDQKLYTTTEIPDTTPQVEKLNSLPTGSKEYCLLQTELLKPTLDDNGDIVPPVLESLVPKVTTSYTKTKLRQQFYTKDDKYVIYMIPIRFFKEYTIALDCIKGAEICCGFYGDYLHELPEKEYLNEAQAKVPPVDMSQFISNQTFKRLPELRFNNPIIWKGIDINTFDEIVADCANSACSKVTTTVSADHFKNFYKQRLLNLENCLKLFLKIPVDTQSSITILEGDFHDFNNMKYAPEYVYKTSAVSYDEIVNGVKQTTSQNIVTAKQIRWVKKQNHAVTNYETVVLDETGSHNLPDVEDRPFRPISPLQLLMFNTGISYPFSDRLIEYLSGNVITEWDENTDNIRRAQKVIELNNNKLSLKGAWEGKMRNILYDYMMQGNPNNTSFGIEVAHDILGYVDKDVEKFYTAWKFENCRDEFGNLIPLTEKFQKIDENGDYIFDENNKPVYEWRPLYKQVATLLEATAYDVAPYKSKLLKEGNDFLLTINDQGNIPLYKQKYVPVSNIQNIDIYGEEE
jgi:hypothetical protein